MRIQYVLYVIFMLDGPDKITITIPTNWDTNILDRMVCELGYTRGSQTTPHYTAFFLQLIREKLGEKRMMQICGASEEDVSLYG